MNESKVNNVFSEPEPDSEETVAYFATVQKQFNINWLQIATSSEKAENFSFQNDTSGESVCYGNDC